MDKRLSQYYKALSNPVRLEVFSLIAQKSEGFAPESPKSEETCVTVIAKKLQVPQPTVSNHIKVLEKAGLTKSVQSGTRSYNYLAKQAAQDLLHHSQHIFEQAHKHPY